MNTVLLVITVTSLLVNFLLIDSFLKTKKLLKNKEVFSEKVFNLFVNSREVVSLRSEPFYRNLSNIFFDFFPDTKKLVLLSRDGENFKVVYGKNIEIPSLVIPRFELPFSESSAKEIEISRIPAVSNYIKCKNGKVFVFDIRICGEIKAKFLIEKSSFNEEEIKILRVLSSLYSTMIATHEYIISQGKFQKDIILTIIRILEYHDPYTKGHSKNVATIASLIAERIGLPDEEIRKTYWAGLVHDIGKIVVSDVILNKETKLTFDEFEVIKKHPVYGHDFLSNSTDLKELAVYVLSHHERWDGKGYPYGLKGEGIPLIARIISVADAWDAMKSKRSYRNLLSDEEALEQLIQHSGKQFDPYIVDIFVNKVYKNLKLN